MPEDFLHDDPRSERIRQQERERIARDLHDELGAQLVGMNMALAQLRDALDRDDQPQARRQADYAQSLLEQASSGMHQIIDGLHPPVAQFGLADALAWQCRQFARQSGRRCELHNEAAAATLQALDEFVVVSLLRIVREAISNALRHGAAGHVEVTIGQHAGALLLTISDDGCGFEAPAGCGAGQGLASMRWRARALGGSLEVDSSPGGGCRIRVSLPVTV